MTPLSDVIRSTLGMVWKQKFQNIHLIIFSNFNYNKLVAKIEGWFYTSCRADSKCLNLQQEIGGFNEKAFSIVKACRAELATPIARAWQQQENYIADNNQRVLSRINLEWCVYFSFLSILQWNLSIADTIGSWKWCPL